MKLRKPSAPFERLNILGESITIDVNATNLVIPTGADTLPLFNEKILDPNRTNSNFGGYSGGVPDFCPGTIHCQTAGVVITDPLGNNSGQTIGAGVLKNAGYLTIDTIAKTITEEFIISNQNTYNNPSLIDSCDAITGWGVSVGTGTISVENGRIKCVGTANSSGRIQIYKNFGTVLNTKQFMSLDIESSVSARTKISIAKTDLSWYKIWEADGRFLIPANTVTRFVYPVKAPQGTAGMNPASTLGTYNDTDNITITAGIFGLTSGQSITFYIDDIRADIANSAYIEINTPDFLADISAEVYCYYGSSYNLFGSFKLDTALSVVVSNPQYLKCLDGTLINDIYGSGQGRSICPKGISGQTVGGTNGNITYSANKGTRHRIGFRLDLPPSDNGRTTFSSIRLKIVIYYQGSDYTYEYEDSPNVSYGLQNANHPLILLLNNNTKKIDFFLTNRRFDLLSFKQNDSGIISEITLSSMNGLIYYGSIPHSNQSIDTGSTGIPDCLKTNVDGSVINFLKSYDFPSVLYISSDGYYYISSDSKTLEATR